jgi:hypothetical protein
VIWNIHNHMVRLEAVYFDGLIVAGRRKHLPVSQINDRAHCSVVSFETVSYFPVCELPKNDTTTT